ncbi:2-oxo-tetronate isomerase [Glutamicibacter sp. X7]
MPKFAANLSMLFTELPFLDRFEVAAAHGFSGVEYLFPYDYQASEIAELLLKHGLDQALFNAYPGDWDAGERGLAALEGREADFDSSIALALDYAESLKCPRVHVMAGNAPATNAVTELYVANLRRAADAAAERDVELLLEPINSRDMPGYFLNTVPQAAELIARIDRPNVRLQFDFYHAQIMSGDITRLFEKHRELVAHVQIASVPERHEPNVGEINYPWLLATVDALGFDGWIGCEYRPASGTVQGLGWLNEYKGA